VSWTCPTCATTVTTAFCAACGEEPVPPRDLTLRGLAAKLVHAVTSIDAKTARSARVLLASPGALTLAWSRGVRKPYITPFALFVVANVIFFGLQAITGGAVLSSPLDSHLHHQDWSELAQSLVSKRLASTRMSLDQYAPAFDRAVMANAKSLIVLMSLAFALILPLVFLRERRAFMVHVVFSLHLYTFLLLLFCVALLAARLSALLGLGGLERAGVDNVLSVLIFTICSIYLYISTGPVYDASGATRVMQTVALALAAVAIVVGYRFIIFAITLYST
jgi:hypothetical protein